MQLNDLYIVRTCFICVQYAAYFVVTRHDEKRANDRSPSFPVTFNSALVRSKHDSNVRVNVWAGIKNMENRDNAKIDIRFGGDENRRTKGI